MSEPAGDVHHGGEDANERGYRTHEVRDTVLRLQSCDPDRPLSALVNELGVDMRPLKTRIEDEMVVPAPDEELIAEALSGAIGIGHKTGQLAALDELSERTGIDRLLSRLLAAWAAAELGHGDGTIPESVLRDHETTATVVTVGRNRWVEHVGDRRRLQRDSRNDVAEYLVARYCG